MEVIALWVIFTFLVVGYAGRRGRNRFVAFILSLLLSPLVGLLIYAVIGESRRGAERRIMQEEKMRLAARQKLEAVRASAPRSSRSVLRRLC